jgi:hypothetical protein
MVTFLLLLQAASAQAPDIELNFHARAKSVRIEQKGVEPKAQGRTELRDVTIDIHAEASVSDPAQIRVRAETGTPQ